jgi:O-antigen/teichoic acid export membrane protein
MMPFYKVKKFKPNELSRLVTGAGFVFACRVSGAVVAYATLVVLARWMGAAELGAYVFAYSWCIILSVVAALGYPNGAHRFISLGLVNRDYSHIRGFVRRGRQIIIASSFVIGAAAAMIILATTSLMSSNQVTPWLIACLCIPVLAWLHLNVAVAHAFSWNALAVIPKDVLRPLLVLLGVVLVRLAGGALTAIDAMLLFLAASLLVAFGQHAALTRRLTQELEDAQPVYETPTWVCTGLPLLLLGLFTAYFPELSVNMAALYLSPEDLAKFSAGIRTALILEFVLTAVDHMILPQVSRLFAQRDMIALQRIVARATQIKFWFAVVAVLGLGVFGKHILALFGETFIEAHGALMISALALLFRTAIGPVALLHLATGHQNRSILPFACAAVAIVILTILLVPRFGINGAATVMLMVTILWSVWLYILVVRHIGVEPSVLSIRYAVR